MIRDLTYVKLVSYILGHQSTTLGAGVIAMTGTLDTSEAKHARQTIVVIELPVGREYVWPSSTASMAGWQTGEQVTYRGRRWTVVSRANGSDMVTFELVPEAGVQRS